MTPLKDILGKPGEGVHFHDWLNIAWFDVLGTFALAFGLLIFLVKVVGVKPTFLATILCVLVMFVLGNVLHLLIGVDTTVAKILKEFLP